MVTPGIACHCRSPILGKPSLPFVRFTTPPTTNKVFEHLHQDTVTTDPAQPRRQASFRPWIVLAGALFVAAAAAHVYVLRQPASYSGPLLILDHVFGVALALILLVICIGVGRHVLHRCRLALDQPLEEVVFSAAVGAAILSASILISGLLAVLWAPVIAAVLVAWALIARREILELPGLCARSAAQLRSRSAHGAYAVAGIGVLVIVAVVLIMQAIAPPADWDSLMYHLQVPQQFLQEGRIYVPVDNLHVVYVGLVHMLYVPLLALGSPASPAILSVFFALLLGLAVFSLAARFFGGATASISLTTVWATTSILLVAITPRLDVTLALYLFLAQYALLVALSEPSRRPYFYLAAFLLGSAIGVKYSALAYILALSPLILWVAFASAHSLRELPKPLTLFGLLLLAAALPWLAKNWLLLQAPLYPFFSARLLPPWLASFYGSRAIPAGFDPEALRALANARLPFNLVDLFTAPGRLTVEQEGVHYHMNLLYLLLPLSVLFIKNRVFSWLVIPAVGYLALILVPFPATNLRYLIPAFAPLTIAAAYIADRLSHRVLSASAARLLLISLAALSLFPSAKAMRFWLSKSDVLGYLAGVTSQNQYLETGFYLYSQLVQATNTLVPRDGKVLMLFEARGYYFKPQVIQDNAITNWALLAPKVTEDGSCLEGTNITHILLNDLAVRYYVSRGTSPQTLGINAFPDFAERCLTLLLDGRGFIIFSLKSESSGSADPIRERE